MKTKFIKIILLLALLTPTAVQAYEDKDFDSSGTINDGEYWGNVNIYGDDTIVDMYYDAWVLNVTTFNGSSFNVHGGVIDGLLMCTNESNVNINAGWFDNISVEQSAVLNVHCINYGGIFHDVSATGGTINIFVDNVIYNSSLGYNGGGVLEGDYLNGTHFKWDLYEGSYQHINIVPEPSSFLLFGLAGLIFRKRTAA